MTQNDSLIKVMDVFIQYGFRKTSMDDVAKAVGVSRQAIYKRFKNKEALFEAVVDDTLHRSFAAARAALNDNKVPFCKRLFNAFDASGGQFVEKLRSSPHGFEVIALANAEAAQEVDALKRQFDAYGAELLVKEGLFTDMEVAKDAMFTIHLVATGLLHTAENRDAFKNGVRRAIRAVIPDMKLSDKTNNTARMP